MVAFLTFRRSSRSAPTGRSAKPRPWAQVSFPGPMGASGNQQEKHHCWGSPKERHTPIYDTHAHILECRVCLSVPFGGLFNGPKGLKGIQTPFFFELSGAGRPICDKCLRSKLDGCDIHFAPLFRNLSPLNINKPSGFNHGFKAVQDFVHPQ